MKASVALFSWTNWPDWSPEAHTERALHLSGFTRITEYVEVDFPDLPKDEVLAERVGSLRKERTETVNDFTKKLEGIDNKIAELLALAAPEQSEPSVSSAAD
jgi:hypothetical protein